MKIGNRSAAVAAALAGLAAMGADPAPATPATPGPASEAATEAAIAKLLPTPRLFDIETTRQGPAATHETMQFCMGGDLMRGLLGAFREHPEAAAALVKGCTHKADRRPDGSGSVEMACDKAAGAAFTSRMTIETDAGLSHLHQHMELEMDLGGATKTVVQDTRMTAAGDCPADLKSGQMRMPDGSVFDGGALFGAPARAGSAKR